ncbi:MAG TPA: response regulator, partial [Terriglobales bacterium]|nr:response regulator [Terriglobales bacterium]
MKGIPRSLPILAVDDEPANLLAVEAVLNELGEEVVVAASGREALRLLLDRDFAVILMDAKMPELDGFATAALIRERPRSRVTPIIFLTALRVEDDMFKAYDLGAVDYLFKPIVPQVLRAKVRFFLELAQSQQQLRRAHA